MSNANFEVYSKGMRRLQTYAQQVAETMTHPELLAILEEIHKEPTREKRKAKARELATVQELCKRGVPLPKTSRIAIRTFEDPTNPKFDDFLSPAGPGPSEEAPTTTVCASIGYIICASIGNVVNEPDDDDGGTGGED